MASSVNVLTASCLSLTTNPSALIATWALGRPIALHTNVKMVLVLSHVYSKWSIVTERGQGFQDETIFGENSSV